MKGGVFISGTIDKNIPIPLYYQIKEYIKNQIADGTLKPGAKLPTESYYSKYFDVSRITVRKALEELIEDRVLVRDKGKSPTVPEKMISRDFDKLEGLGQQIRDQGKVPSSVVIHFEVVKANEEHVKKYKCELNDELFSAIRLRYADNELIAVQNLIVIKKLVPDLTKEYLETGSLYKLVRNHNLKIKYAKQTLGADLLPETLCDITGMSPNTLCILSDRITYLDNDQVVENSISHYIASRYVINMTLHAE